MSNEKKGPFDDNANAKAVIDLFHQIYYHSNERTWENTYWMGHQTLKCPLDMWIYQEIIFDTKPDVIIETGTFSGGSALFFAMICDSIGEGRIITIDIEIRPHRPEHPRITYLSGSSTSQEIVDNVKEIIGNNKKVLVILDSEHTKDHVLQECKMYSQFVNKDSYLIVEDSDINGHPVRPEFGPGPFEAVEEFLKSNNDFVIDTSKEKFLMTQNPNGYLKRVT